MALVAIEKLLEGRRVLEAAPTSDQTDAFWTQCCAALAEPIAAGLVRKNETQRILELQTVPLAIDSMPDVGLLENLKVESIPRLPRIRCKTAYDADTLRGDYADVLILDEYSIMDKSAWAEVGAPMLLDNDGDAIFIFTPKRLNHAHDLYLQAVGDTTGRWEAFHFTSFDNPHLSKSALAEVTSDLTDDMYRQEILAQFLQNAGAVFRNILACLKAQSSTADQHAGHRIVIGVDWGKVNDFTVVSVFCDTCKCEVFLDRFNHLEWSLQRARVQNVYTTWSISGGLVEINSIGGPNFEALLPFCPTLNGFEMTGTSKSPLIQSLALAFEREEAQWIDDPVGKHELMAYESKTNPMTGRTTYGVPDGQHDDTVIGRALAYRAALNPMQDPMPSFSYSQFGRGSINVANRYRERK
jgi:hypothetical protein